MTPGWDTARDPGVPRAAPPGPLFRRPRGRERLPDRRALGANVLGPSGIWQPSDPLVPPAQGGAVSLKPAPRAPVGWKMTRGPRPTNLPPPGSRPAGCFLGPRAPPKPTTPRVWEDRPDSHGPRGSAAPRRTAPAATRVPPRAPARSLRGTRRGGPRARDCPLQAWARRRAQARRGGRPRVPPGLTPPRGGGQRPNPGPPQLLGRPRRGGGRPNPGPRQPPGKPRGAAPAGSPEGDPSPPLLTVSREPRPQCRPG